MKVPQMDSFDMVFDLIGGHTLGDDLRLGGLKVNFRPTNILNAVPSKILLRCGQQNLNPTVSLAIGSS